MGRLWILCALALLAAGSWCGAVAQSRLGGRVVYAPSGHPVVGGHVRIVGTDGYVGLDGDGRFSVKGPLPVHFEALVICPVTRRLWGRSLGPFEMTWDGKTDTLPWVTIPEAQCLEPPEMERGLAVSGLYSTAFEESSFMPCVPFADLSGTAYDGSDPSAWVVFEEGVGVLPPPTMHETTGGYTEARWFLRVHGVLRGPGSFGHMGMSLYLLTVDSVLEARQPGPNDCSG